MSRVFRFARRLCLSAATAERTRLTLGRPVAVLLSAILLLAPPNLFAGSTSAKMNVSVQVIARAVLSVDGTASVAVTAEDVSRGYVDVVSPIRLTTRTNSRGGYLLTATPLNASFAAVELSTAGVAMTLRETDAWLQRPYVPGGDTLALHARLWLAPGTATGIYEFPVAFSASPL